MVNLHHQVTCVASDHTSLSKVFLIDDNYIEIKIIEKLLI